MDDLRKALDNARDLLTEAACFVGNYDRDVDGEPNIQVIDFVNRLMSCSEALAQSESTEKCQECGGSKDRPRWLTFDHESSDLKIARTPNNWCDNSFHTNQAMSEEEEMEAAAKKEWLRRWPGYQFDDPGKNHVTWEQFLVTWKAAWQASRGVDTEKQGEES